jgi:hypothetical protein
MLAAEKFRAGVLLIGTITAMTLLKPEAARIDRLLEAL